MEGFIFLLAIIGVGMVISWARRNDKVPLDGETSGLLAMRAAPSTCKRERE